MSAQPASILIVEDELLITLHLSTDLKRAGYQVYDPVMTGAEAIKRALAQRPTVILMDISLPGSIDGLEAAEAIRAQLDVPIVFITGYSDPWTVVQVQRFQRASLAVKPLSIEQLDAAIRAILEQE